MKTLFMILAMVMFTSVAQAENWQFVTDSEDVNYPGRTLIDADSMMRIMMKGTHESMLKGRIRVVGTNANPPDWEATVIIDFDQCLKSKNGNMLFTPDSEKSTKYFWDINGNKMYDYVGAYMCGFASTHKDDPAYNPSPEQKKNF